MRFDTPLSLSVDLPLELAFRESHLAWTEAVRERGTSATANWLIRRSVGVDVDVESIKDAIAGIALSKSAPELAEAQIELASLIRTGDVEMAELLWKGVRDFAIASGDSDLVNQSTQELSAIAEELGESESSGKLWIEFLNWRRRVGSTCDPETVLQAFDEVIRAAEQTGEHRQAAHFSYLQVQFQALVDSDDPRAASGNWMTSDDALEIWP